MNPFSHNQTAAGAEQARWFEEEIQPHEPKLRAWLRARFPSLHELDDLVQESYVRIIQARENGKLTNAKSYLFATARNAAIDLFRRSRLVRVETIDGDAGRAVIEDAPSIPDALHRDHELALLAAAIQSLPTRCRRVVVLQKLHGFTYKQIAAELGISERTVNAQIAKGVLRIRNYMRSRREDHAP